MSPLQGVTYPKEPGRHLNDWRLQVQVPHPSLVPPDRQVQDEYFDADRVREELEPTEPERQAVSVAARYVGTTISTLQVLCARLYGAKPDDLTSRQSKRTDGLLRLAWYVARENGYEPAWKKNPPGKSAGARVPVEPPEQTEAA